ncbi:DUF1176 domain-containing protein [Stenotrophomonas indicatrix]|uniref:DUF1176 domain-containing protein n=1 Tax=Stenotrophomonas indicatrix TaxID=2045451 RepID=UPI00249C3127|nr:DUF1176 domain-containing protein [Stenotrophomonas indicatrix]WGV54914.1 DUF1176 domain-containing protein [Stenotrophomonas indicatrix]
MRSPLLPTLLALCWPLAASAVDAPAGLYFQHHDWVVACDNTRTCRAAGYASGDDSTGRGLRQHAHVPRGRLRQWR